MISELGHNGAGVIDPATEPTGIGNRTDAQGKDHALQLVRRLDWRFLLPNPVLGDVAYIGSLGGTLPSALRQFSDLLTIVPPSDLSSADVTPDIKLGCPYETVVLRSSAVAAVKKVRPLLAPGGYLYWEVERVSGIDHVRNYTRAVERLGFDDIQVNWHRPDFETCLEMIPLTDSRALRFAFARRQESTRKRLKFAAGRLLMTTGLLARVVPCFSIVARRGV
jgi:hypothetical protein